ncbi:MAG: peptidyl-prolyl cis-trans isomerase [Thermodesulfovibrionales bacterium]|nr:peptidyl-prolyl cis-trans isomerase [Thermodesulfovibrionales bacterium]
MKKLGFLLTLLLLFLYGCSRNAITVDGEGIPKEVYNAVVKERLEAHKAMGIKFDEKALRRTVADELIAEVLLLKEVRSRKIEVKEDEVKKIIDSMRGNKTEEEFRKEVKKAGLSYDTFKTRVRNRLLIAKLMEELVKDDSVTEKDMMDFYKKSQVPFLKPETVFVKIVQLNTEDDAKKAMEAIKKGEDFDKLADRLLKENKASVTDYGWLNPDTISKEIGEAMKTAKLNQAYGPYKGKDNSYYIFRIKEREASRVLSFNEAKPQIKAMILQQRRQELMAHLVDVNRKKAKIKYNISF